MGCGSSTSPPADSGAPPKAAAASAPAPVAQPAPANEETRPSEPAGPTIGQSAALKKEPSTLNLAKRSTLAKLNSKSARTTMVPDKSESQNSMLLEPEADLDATASTEPVLSSADAGTDDADEKAKSEEPEGESKKKNKLSSLKKQATHMVERQNNTDAYEGDNTGSAQPEDTDGAGDDSTAAPAAADDAAAAAAAAPAADDTATPAADETAAAPAADDTNTAAVAEGTSEVDPWAEEEVNGIPRVLASAEGYKRGRLACASDCAAVPEHLFYVFNLWAVLRPGLRGFMQMLHDKRGEGIIKGIYIYTANTSLEWVKFIMTAMVDYYGLPLDTFDGIRHAPGGLKEVPANAMLYDDHPENVEGNCVPVDPYHNDIPWSMLEPVVQVLPDDGKGGLQVYIDKDKAYPDQEHDKESEGTLTELTAEFEADEGVEDVLLDLDETLIAGARMSAYFFALNHFLKFNVKA